MRSTAPRNSGVLPARGGSRNTTSARSPRAAMPWRQAVASAQRKRALPAPLARAFWAAHRAALGLNSTPSTRLARPAAARPMVPTPQ